MVEVYVECTMVEFDGFNEIENAAHEQDIFLATLGRIHNGRSIIYSLQFR